ncbi:TPA: PGF-pre-PGF domain-containing protein [archaeon]|nr:PGF-pre-PGF domain-containing protein [Candidatus Naiadarchaeales archaeon SRR2090153.bin461]
MRNINFAGGLAVSTVLLLTIFFAMSFFSAATLAVNLLPNVTNISVNPLSTINYTTPASIQERVNYTLFLPAMSWNESAMRPTLIRSGYAEIMHFTKDPFADFTPDGVFFPAYSFAVNVTNTTNLSDNRVVLYVTANQSIKEGGATAAFLENATQTMALFSESVMNFFSFETNATISQKFRFPCPVIQNEACGQLGSNLTIYIRNSSADWTILTSLLADNSFNVSLSIAGGPPNMDFATPTQQFFNMTVAFTNRTAYTNWTAINFTYGLIDPRMLAQMRPGNRDKPNFMTSPVTLLSQFSSGFDESAPMEPGVNSTMQAVANLYNNLTNYTLENVLVRFPLPVNVTVMFNSAIQNPYNPSQNVTSFSMYPVSIINVTAACAGAGSSPSGPAGTGVSLLNASNSPAGMITSMISPSGYPSGLTNPFYAFPVNYTNKTLNFTDTGKHGDRGGKEQGGFGGGKATSMGVNITLMDIYVNLSAIGCNNNTADGVNVSHSSWNYSTNVSINFTATMNVPKFAEEFKNTSTTGQKAYANRTVYASTSNQAVKFSNSSLPGWGTGTGTGGNVTNGTVNVTVDGVNTPPCGSNEANATNANGGGNTCWVESGSVTIQGLGSGSHSLSVNFETATAVSTAGTTSTTGGSSGGSVVAGPVFKTTITSITGGETKTVSPGDTSGFSGMDILTTETVNNVKLEVGKMTTAPTEVTTPLEGKVNYYVQVNTTGISESQLSSVKLRFKVTKQWLTDKGVSADDVALWRFSGGAWKELTTTKTAEGETSISYEATSPGLSTFAVATKSTAATPTAPGEPTAPTKEGEEEAAAPVTQNITLIAIIVIIIIIAAVWYYQKGGKLK